MSQIDEQFPVNITIQCSRIQKEKAGRYNVGYMGDLCPSGETAEAQAGCLTASQMATKQLNQAPPFRCP